MATSTVPIGNAAGNNQANPAMKLGTPTSTISKPVGPPPPGGSPASPHNPYILGASVPGSTGSGTAPSTTSAPAGSLDANVLKQWTDIYGKGTGGAEAAEYKGMQGTDSAAFEALKKSMAPSFAEGKNDLLQTLGVAGVGPNSTVASLGLADLATKQEAILSGADANMIMENQRERLGLLQGTQQDAAQEVASSGWDIFGQVMGDVGSLASTFMGMGGVPGIGKLFGMGAKTGATGAADLSHLVSNQAYGNPGLYSSPTLDAGISTVPTFSFPS